MRSDSREGAGNARARGSPPASDILPGKLLAPYPPPGVLRRRLHRALDDGVDAGVTLVSGMAGAGKTHLVAEWAAGRQRTPRELAWLTLDVHDRDPHRFLRYVTAAIAGTGAGRAAISVLDPLLPGQAISEREVAAIQRAMDRLTGKVVLVLDDFHTVVGSPTEALLRAIVQYRPGLVRVIVLSRVVPDLDQARLKVARRLHEIGTTELALTRGEVRALLASSGVILTDSVAELVRERTEGWVAAVQLTASLLRSAPNAAAAVRRLPADSQALYDYVLAEVYARQPADLQAFMRRTCVVDRVGGELADALTGNADGEAKLAELVRANLVVDVDPAGPWYRWQPTLAGVLRARLHAVSPRLEQELHVAAARWLRAAELPADAIRHAVAGGERATAAAILGDCWLDLVVSEQSQTLRHLVDLIDPDNTILDADVAVARAFLAARADDVEASTALAHRALALARDLPAPHRLAVEVMATVTRLYTETLAAHGGDADAYASGLAQLAQMSRPDVPLSRGERIRRALLLFQLGAFEAARLADGVGTAHLRQALFEAATIDLPYLQLSCRAQLVRHDVWTGELTAGAQRGRDVLDTAARRGWPSQHGLTTAHVNLAAIAILQDELDTALHHLDEADRIARRADRVNAIRISFLRLLALCAAGKTSDAYHELENLRGQTARPGVPDFIAVVMSIAEALGELCYGRPGAALKRLDSVAGGDFLGSLIRPYPVVRADVLLRCGQPARAREILAPYTERTDARAVQVAALVVDALVADELDLHDEALEALDMALETAGPEPLLEPFLAPGSAIRSLLQQLLQRGTGHEPLAVEILSHTARNATSPHPTSGRSRAYVEPLSRRELEVLRNLQGTYTNRALADKLCISEATLRTHIRNINLKLGTSDRHDAVRRARELAIL